MDAGQPDALLSAVAWMRDVLLGGAAVSVAAIAVASLGVAMLAGRVEWRRGAWAILGCFVLFGAPVIAAGLTQAATPAAPVVVAPLPAAPAYHATAPSAPAFDPYAGAAVPTQR